LRQKHEGKYHHIERNWGYARDLAPLA